MVQGLMMSMPLNIASLLVVVRKPGETVTREELFTYFADKVARWQIPDDVVFVESIPLGATGKMLKAQLRPRFRDYQLPDANA